MGRMLSKSASMLRPFDWHRAIAALLCALAFWLSLLVSDRVFEGLPHLEDEVAYLFQARVFAAGAWVIPSPPVRQAFTQPFIVDHAGSGEMRRFSKYPPGWSLLLGGGLAMGYGAWVNAAFAAAAVALVYRLGHVFSPHVGLIAALLLAFSPAALLLNGSLMAHSAALALACGFLWCVWNAEQTGRRWRWALAAGALLGVLLLTRPAPAVAVALPLMTWLGGRMVRMIGLRRRMPPLYWRGELGVRPFLTTFVTPYVGLALVALSVQAVNMAYSAAATGDPRANLYTLVWSYDRIGFGACCGRTGHTLEKAIRHVRFDMSLAAADLFGWQWGGWRLGDDLPPELREHLLTKATYWPPLGLSFVLLPFGVLIGAAGGRGRRAWGAAAWALMMSAWAVLPVVAFPLEALRDPAVSWAWIVLGLLLALAPMLAIPRAAPPTVALTWLLVSFTACIVIFQMTYWVGAQRYSARYWYEAAGAACLLSALPLAALLPRSTRWRALVYAALLALVLYAHYAYSIPRVSVLHQFNNVSRAHIAELNARRDGRPALVLVTGPLTGDYRVTWRAFGTYTALTSPFLDSDVVVARLPEGDAQRREEVLALFPTRQVIEMRALASEAWFVNPP